MLTQYYMRLHDRRHAYRVRTEPNDFPGTATVEPGQHPQRLGVSQSKLEALGQRQMVAPYVRRHRRTSTAFAGARIR